MEGRKKVGAIEKRGQSGKKGRGSMPLLGDSAWQVRARAIYVWSLGGHAWGARPILYRY